MLKEKGFTPVIILLVIVVILGLMGGAYYFGKSQSTKPLSQNPVVTSTPQSIWKTYKNEGLEFSIQYPIDQNIEIIEVSKSTVLMSKADQERKRFYLIIDVFNNAESLSTDGIKQQITSAPGVSKKILSTIKTYQNGELNGIYFINDQIANNWYAAAVIRVVHNNKIYSFTLHDQGSLVSEESRKLVEQILSTFKFTN